MTISEELHTISGTDVPRSFGWRHKLAWDQLAALWKLRVSHHLLDSPPTRSTAQAGCSLAIAAAEFDSARYTSVSVGQAPTVVFLNGVGVRYDKRTASLSHELQTEYAGTGGHRHVLRIEKDHPLLEGLPEALDIYGACPTVTPLTPQPGSTVLVSLNRVPIIAVYEDLLFVGADPWQFGNPAIPMLYKILSNWLRQRAGCEHAVLEPLAVIRLDDLPTTAEELETGVQSQRLDKKRARTIRRLVKFAQRTGTKFTVMYSSHYRGEDGSLKSIRSAMPRSVELMQSAVKIGAFEVGSHGMVHLRENSANKERFTASMEFLELDEQETAAHLRTAEQEIADVFEAKPQSFVAPAWGYRPGVTKKIAAGWYPAIVDSSQHVETGECDILLRASAPPDDYFNMVETFRTGNRMLTYANPDFWKCFASCGIPVHYMQHTDTNWQILKTFLLVDAHRETELPDGSFMSKVFDGLNDPKRRGMVRAACASVLVIRTCLFRPSSWRFLWHALTGSSIYSFIRALRSAGYTPVTLAEFTAVAARYAGGKAAVKTVNELSMPDMGRGAVSRSYIS